MPVADDSVDEADGTVTVTLSAPVQNAGYRLGSPTTATGAVADDDVPQVSIADATGVTEGTALTFTVTASPAPYQALTVALAVDDGAGDFLPGSGVPTSVTVPTGGSVTVNVPTQGDSVDEADGTVTVTLSAGTGYDVSTTNGAATGAVADDDVRGLTFAPAAPAIGEGVTADLYTVVLDSEPTATVTVTLLSGDLGALTVMPATLQFTASDWSSPRQVRGAGIEDDDNDDETVTVSHAVSGGDYGAASVGGSVTVTVTDDDTPGITLSRNTLEVGENSGTATYTIRLNTRPARSGDDHTDKRCSRSRDRIRSGHVRRR